MSKTDSRSKKSMSLSGSGNLGSSVSLGANMENQRYQNQQALPTEGESKAKMFSEISKNFSAPGDRPRGLWNNIATGAAEGLAHGARQRDINEKKDNFDKYDNVMNYFEEVNNAAVQRNEHYEKKEMGRKQALPQLLSFLDNIDKLDPQSQRNMGQDILDRYNETIGEDYRLSGIDGVNPTLWTVKSGDETKVIDVRSFFAGDAAVEQAIAMKMPEYQMKLQEERQDKQKKFDLEQQKLEILRESTADKNAVQREKLEQTTRRNDQNAMKADVKLTETLGKKIDSSREFLTIVPKMEEIVKYHPDIFQSAVDATWREAKEPGYINNFLKAAQNKLNPEKVAALTSMVKYINKMTLDVANGFARPNMFIEKIGSKAVPNLDMNPQGFLKVLGEMKKENETSIKNNLSRFDLLKSDIGNGISDQYRDSTNDVMGPRQASGNSVTIFDPETGEQETIPEEQLDTAVHGGWELKQ